MPENKTVAELHGCIVCARIFDVVTIYTPDNQLVERYISNTSAGYILPEKENTLVVCNRHTAAEVEMGYQRWLTRNGNLQTEPEE